MDNPELIAGMMTVHSMDYARGQLGIELCGVDCKAHRPALAHCVKLRNKNVRRHNHDDMTCPTSAWAIRCVLPCVPMKRW